MALFSNLYALRLQRLEKILRQTSGCKSAGWSSYGNLGKVTQNPHLLKKCKGGTKRNFSKIVHKNSPYLKKPTALWPKWHYPVIIMQLKCKDWTKLWRKKSSKSARKAKLWQFLKRLPKPAFSKKVQRGGQGKFLKNWDKK